MSSAKPATTLDRYNAVLDLIDRARDKLTAAQRIATPRALLGARRRLQNAQQTISQALALCEPTTKEKGVQ